MDIETKLRSSIKILLRSGFGKFISKMATGVDKTLITKILKDDYQRNEWTFVHTAFLAWIEWAFGVQQYWNQLFTKGYSPLSDLLRSYPTLKIDKLEVSIMNGVVIPIAQLNDNFETSPSIISFFDKSLQKALPHDVFQKYKDSRSAELLRINLELTKAGKKPPDARGSVSKIDYVAIPINYQKRLNMIQGHLPLGPFEKGYVRTKLLEHDLVLGKDFSVKMLSSSSSVKQGPAKILQPIPKIIFTDTVIKKEKKKWLAVIKTKEPSKIVKPNILPLLKIKKEKPIKKSAPPFVNKGSKNQSSIGTFTEKKQQESTGKGQSNQEKEEPKMENERRRSITFSKKDFSDAVNCIMEAVKPLITDTQKLLTTRIEVFSNKKWDYDAIINLYSTVIVNDVLLPSIFQKITGKSVYIGDAWFNESYKLKALEVLQFSCWRKARRGKFLDLYWNHDGTFVEDAENMSVKY
jgi:hypothetical protein